MIPSQLEAILKSHPAVEDAAVVGIKSEDYGELPMAYAMKKPGHDKLDARRLVNFLHGSIRNNFGKPSYLIRLFIDHLILQITFTTNLCCEEDSCSSIRFLETSWAK